MNEQNVSIQYVNFLRTAVSASSEARFLLTFFNIYASLRVIVGVTDVIITLSTELLCSR